MEQDFTKDRQAIEAEEDQARRTRLATERRLRDFWAWSRCPHCDGKGIVLNVNVKPSAIAAFMESKA